jgi:hypothetical protein
MHEIFVAGPRGRDRNVVGPMKSVPITIKFNSLLYLFSLNCFPLNMKSYMLGIFVLKAVFFL